MSMCAIGDADRARMRPSSMPCATTASTRPNTCRWHISRDRAQPSTDGPSTGRCAAPLVRCTSQPDPYRVPHGLDRVALAHGRHLVREPRGDVGLNGVQGRSNSAVLSANLVQRPPGDPRRRRDRVGRHLSEAVRGDSSRAAAISASRVAADRSAWVRRGRVPAEVGEDMARFSHRRGPRHTYVQSVCF